MADKTIFITGGAGFIGSNFIRLVLRERPGYRIINFDLLTYAGNLENLKGIDESRYRFIRGDVADGDAVKAAVPDRGFALVNFAAESHVDRSILGPEAFVRSNVTGTQTLLDVAREKGIERFIQISTDEVYGSLGDEGKFTEGTPLAPNSPYSASKAAADLLALAAFKTYGQAVILTRCSNNYGPFQFPEKLIPLMVSNALEDEPLPVYGDGLNVRDWIHVKDHCRALLTVLEEGRAGEVYNIGASSERPNIDVVKEILRQLRKPESLIRFVKDRPGHDRRYAIDSGKIEGELGWKPTITFAKGLAATIQWYRDNRRWWKCIKDGSYREFYEKWYGNR
ncbi:MAG: dTDP-glucose 4,6-dehydratase [Planctomycetia bacterium]|nr:dTDP-glucose 4,6-dehydratase [Planctomycetia bacterium]